MDETEIYNVNDIVCTTDKVINSPKMGIGLIGYSATYLEKYPQNNKRVYTYTLQNPYVLNNESEYYYNYINTSIQLVENLNQTSNYQQ